MRNLKLREKYQLLHPLHQKKRNPLKPFPSEKISIPENLTPFRKLQSSHAHTEIIPIPPEKSQTLPKASPPLPKNLNPSRNFPEKLPLPKNSITITETISNTRTKSQPLPEKSQPLVKNSQSLLKKSQPPTP